MSFLPGAIVPSVIALGLAALAAVALTLTRRSPEDRTAERHSAARVLTLAVAAQGIHFVEEAATGFHQRFGPLFGFPEMPFFGFVVFNIACLVMWVASIPGLRSARSAAFFAAWFLALAGMLNGLAHPMLALAGGGYFPGLVSSPFIALAAAWLWLRLWTATQLRRR